MTSFQRIPLEEIMDERSIFVSISMIRFKAITIIRFPPRFTCGEWTKRGPFLVNDGKRTVIRVMKRPLRINVRYRVTILCTSKSATTPGTQTMREVVKRDWNRGKV